MNLRSAFLSSSTHPAALEMLELGLSLVASRETNFENKERKIRNESWKQVLSFAINVLTQRPLNANVFIDYDDEEGGVWYAHR